jgi:hypothetical protein
MASAQTVAMETTAHFYTEKATLLAHFFFAFSMALIVLSCTAFRGVVWIGRLCALCALLRGLLQKCGFLLFREVVGHFGNYIL